MGLLDRFRSQPAWQHSEASVRAAAIQELPDEDQDLLWELALQDPDASVRRAAVRRLGGVERLATIARNDLDEHVRAEARGVVLQLAREGTDEAAAEAVAALTESRELADVAKHAALESVGRAALARVTDVKALGSVARRSAHPDLRREALARIDAPDELANIALRSEDKEISLSALERVLQVRADDRELLATLSVRAQNRVVARRVRSILRGLEEPGGSRTAELRREERSRLCAEAEALGQGQAVEPAQLRAALDAVQAQWADLIDSEEVEAPADAAGERFDTACQSAWRRLAELEAAHAAEVQRATARAQALQSYADLCALVDTLDGADALQRLEQAQQMWADLPALAQDEPQAIAAARFTAAVEACRTRSAEWQAGQAARAEFERLLVDAGAAADLPDVREARTRLATVELAWNELVSAGRPDAELRAQFAAARERLRVRERSARADREREQQQNAARIATLCDRLETMARSDRLTLREADLGLREARSTLNAIGVLPRRERDRLTTRVRSVHAILAARVRELRDLKDWQKWANVGVQEELCAEAEALDEFNDLPQLARRLRRLLDRWKQVSVAPKREETDALWRRFTAAYDKAHARCEQYLAAQAAIQSGNVKLKETLCALAEALAEATDWVKTSQQFERLQTEWKAIGPVPRDQMSQLWKRFRTACDRFYTRRKADLVQRKAGWAKNLERKEALCAQAEALAETTDWELGAAEIRKLQAEWRTVGPLKKSRSEALWQRFRSACDRFFERYNQRDRLELEAKLAAREEILGDLAALVADEAGATEVPVDLVERVTRARTRWHASAFLPFPEEARQARRIAAALAKVIDVHASNLQGTEIDPRATQRKMEKLCAKAEALLPSDTVSDADANLSPAEVLALRWRDVLAAKQLGVTVDEDAKWRTAAAEVKQVQEAWRPLWPVPGEAGRLLAERFERACGRILNRARPRRVAPSAAQSK